MKVFNKFLAVTLALVTVLTLIPFSVFAKEATSEPWLEVEGSVENPDLPVVTVTVDADALMALLRGGDSSAIAGLKSGIALDIESLLQVFTVEELFEIIPQKDLLEILPLEDIVEQIGLEMLESYVDKSVLIESVSKEDLVALLSDIDNLGEIVDLEAALKVIDKDLLLKHVDKNAVYDDVDLWEALELLGGYENATKYVHIDGLLADPDLDASVLVSAVDFKKLVEKIGLDHVDEYVDLPTLVEKLGNDTVKKLLAEVSDLSEVVDVDAALKLIDKDLLLKHTDKDAVYNEVDVWEAIELLGGYKNAIKYIYVDTLLADPDLDMGVLVSYVDTDALLDEIGLDKLKEYVDLPALVKGLSDDSVKALLDEIADLSEVINVSEALKNIDKTLILK